MPGVYGYVKKNMGEAQLDVMTGAMISCQNIKSEPVFSGAYIEAGRTHIGAGDTFFKEGDVHVWLDGEVYNIPGFPQAVCRAYNAGTLDALLKTANGPFAAILYDAKTQKILLITERLGFRPLYYYFKDGRFAWAGEVKALLSLDFVDKEIDRSSPDCFMDIGYLLEDHTWFEYIKVPKPASIYTFDLGAGTLEQRYYFMWSEIKQQDMSFDAAVDRAYILFMQAFERCFDPSARMGIGISGGLDSRLLIAAANRLYPEYKGFAFTFGRPESKDVAIAKKVVDLCGWDYRLYQFTNVNWFEPRFEQIWRTDGMLNMLHMHGGEFLEDIKKHADILLNGYAGDTILGGGFLSADNIDKRISQPNARPFYGARVEMTYLDDPFYDLPHSEPHIYANRCRRFTHLGAVNASFVVDIRMPFLDLDLMEFVYSIPDTYRKGNKLYTAMLLKYFPEFYKDIPWQKTGHTIDKKLPPKFLSRLKGKIARTLAVYGMGENKNEYVAYGKWVREPEITKKLFELLDYEGTEYSRYLNVDLRKKYLEPHLAHRYLDNSDKILRAATMEVYLSRVFRGMA